MDPHYMESIWWVFKTLYDKGLIYEGHKAMHICPRCNTTLSNFEVSQNYKDLTDLSAIAKFELVDEPGTFVLAWTTTPWTLPGNVALALGENIPYIKVELEGKKYILAQANLDQLISNYKKLGAIKAVDLIGKKYRPLFDYFVGAELKNKENLYTIQTADFVTTEDGTGIVHIAPGFGEDDLNLGREKKLPTIIHVTPEGRFTSEVTDWAGQVVKSSVDPQVMDKLVVEYLKNKDLLFKSEVFTHSYPHCWRCDTPLLNYATTSWFVKVTEIKDQLIKNNQQIHWTPDHLKEGRFGKWLENASDWSISRQRYWGTPIPIWKCQIANGQEQIANSKTGCGHVLALGSIDELEKLSGKKVADLHKHLVDEIEIKCEKCGGVMKKIPDVLDCWFESGSMPYAQIHYPFENREWFEKNFPAQFIAEGVDQTRGWFYTLMVLSTALFNKPAFKNVIANGIVLAADGQKMSKRLKNYPEPDDVIQKYGADALRYYLLTSPVMEAESLSFSEDGVKEALQKVVMLSGNVLSFYKMYAEKGYQDLKPSVANILDQWILAKLNQFNVEVTKNLENYDLVRAARPIESFINELSTWYLRRSRDRFKEGDVAGIKTLGYVLLEFSKISAPFLPFTAEVIYRGVGGQEESVHLADWPKAQEKLIDEKLLSDMQLVREIVEKGLAARAEVGIKIRQPLLSVAIKNEQTGIRNQQPLLDLIADELNVKKVEFVKAQDKEVMLDTTMTPELEEAGLLREIIRQINQQRKEARLTIKNEIDIYQTGLDQIFDRYGEEIKKATVALNIINETGEKMKPIAEGQVGIKVI